MKQNGCAYKMCYDCVTACCCNDRIWFILIDMAGRGRARGKTVSFDVQALGFGRGEALPAANFQPPPLFPTQEFKPIPLDQNEDCAYLLALKQEFVTSIRKSPYYLKLDERNRDIERYSDKYQLNQMDCSESLNADWRRLPSELKIKVRKTRKASSVKPNIVAHKKENLQTDIDEKEIKKTLETLEKKEESGVETEEVGGENQEDEEEEKDDDVEDFEGEEYDEDDLEEETDYAFSYFDNGEGYGDDDGDDDEGPVY